MGRRPFLALLLLLVCRPAIAQEELLPLWLLPFDVDGVTDVKAESFQLYRIPFALALREADSHRPAIELMLPVSVGGYEVTAATSARDLVGRLDTISFVPGVEMRVPVGFHWRVAPFGEVGVIASAGGGSAAVLYGAGVRTRGGYEVKKVGLTLGGVLAYRSGGGQRSLVEHYSTAAAVVDAQLPLGFTVAGRRARAGVFSMIRGFSDVKLRDTGAEPVPLSRQFEVGLSFSTDPPLHLWKLTFPWIGIAYKSAGSLSGVSLYSSFPL